MSGIRSQIPSSGMKCKTISDQRHETVAGVLFTLPAMIGYICFAAVPMIVSLILSFTNYSVARPFEFVGLHNYIRLFSGEDSFFYQAIKVTIYLTILNVPACILISLLLALLLNNKIRGWKTLRVVYYLPTVIPQVATSVIWMWIMSPDFGILNYVLKLAGLPASQWLFGEKTVIPSFVIIAVWTSGNIMTVFLAGIQDVPRSLYEAMDIDGGGTLEKTFYVTLPMISPTIFFNLVMHTIATLQAVLQAFVITQGGPNNASLLYVYYLYREAFEFDNLGGSCAIAWVLFFGVAAVTLVFFKTSGKWVFFGGER